MGRGELARRTRGMLGFALLLMVCIATPVLAETPGEPPLPEVQHEEARPAEELESPQAAVEREESEYAYADLAPSQEENLLREQFAPLLEEIDADPARVLEEVVLNKIHSPTEALVTIEGEKTLLESPVPLRAPEEDGDLSKVDLALEPIPGGFELANPLVEVGLPDSAQGEITIGDEGLGVTPVTVSDAPASPLADEDLFLPAVQEDTSLLVSPIAGGVELSAMLASRNSPEELSFDVSLPPGTQLRASGSGGAEVVDAAGGVVATISAPRAVDAQGTSVPTTLSVAGGRATISVPHQDLELAYPLFVDPEIVEDWWGFADPSKLGYWHWSWAGVGPEDFIGSTSCIVTCWGNERGLYVRARSNFTYPGGSWARWWFTPQGTTTFMRRVIVGPINYDPHGCWANEPHPYVGVWNDYTGWAVLANAYPTGWGSYVDTGSQNLGVGTRTAFVGIHAGGTVTLTCGRDYSLGGAMLFLDDAEQPTAHATSGSPAGWLKKGSTFTISAPVSDPGLGVKRAHMSLGGSVVATKELGCDGHYSNQCPAAHTFQFPFGAESLDEGEKSIRFSAEDALGKPSNTYEWMMRTDRTPPEVDLAGQLAQATDETEGDAKDDKDKALPLPVYNLTINATDGQVATPSDPVEPGEKRSGVRKIEVFIDDKAAPEQTWEASSCPSGNCPLSKVFTLKLNELNPDAEHYLRILVTDFAGNVPRERKVEFEYIPATGMKNEYVMQYFPLPDGSGNEEEEEHPSRPELAVNLVSGNLVYRQEDADISGPGADLELELFYNSLLPESRNTEWGDGWTLTQTPELEIEDPQAPGLPEEATIVEESGAVESKVDLPTGSGEEIFDKQLQATITKEADGDYELTDESGETLTFSASGKAEALSNGTAATVGYDYEEGDLTEITIEDPGTANVNPESLEEGDGAPDVAVTHSTNFGSLGAGDGQLKTPADVVTDPQGNLWVLDRGNGRIQKFGPDGQFLAKFGAPGTANGQLNSPSAIALDADGNILVAENHRVQKLSPSGQFLSKFGSLGFGNGLFAYPLGITVGVDGTIWVASSERVQRFTAAGQFVERIGASGTGQISQPQSLATAANGDVFVADAGSDRIKVFDKEGDFIRQFGSSGSGQGQFENPTEIDLDSSGDVWVADAQTDRVQLFTGAGDYVAQFGAPGTGSQQLQLEEHTGIAAELGRIWIADPGNSRMGRWAASPITSFIHSTNFAGLGAADGELKTPADVVTDPQGNFWVLDRGNGRIQKFGPDGQFISKFGAPGSADGLLSSPAAIALDQSGNVLVAESQRVQRFSPSGEFLGKFGAAQQLFHAGITVGTDGAIWVTADGTNVQRFTAGGQFIETVGGAGAFSNAQSMDTAPSGDVFIVDAALDRVKVFSKEGDFIRQFGAAGTGPGQFSDPTEIDVDSNGNVWVADAQTDRVQLFTGAGDYIAQFGSFGDGAQQFKLEQHTGLVVDQGRVWVADAGNNRVEEWLGGNYEASSEPVLTEDDPQLEVNVSDGLVDSVEGEESGTIDYEHSDDLLTAVSAPDGEAEFAYDEEDRMTKVVLPNGTYGEIAYEPTYGRVKSVTVAINGTNPKTTYFNYSEEPRRTTVVPPDSAMTTYDIAADGSIFKWWNTKQPPIFDYIAGTLYDPNNRETSTPIEVGEHTLSVQAHDEEGIASIQFIANGNQLVDERTCDFDPAEPTKCTSFSNEWVTETGNWPPGILYIEAIATDRLGEAVSQRFWVNIPYTPPPDPEAEEPPRFSDILRFREEFGLDLDLKDDEFAIHDRIFELMGDWHNPNTPAGEIARATAARWSVPMRAVDAAEMEFRQSYIDHDSVAVEEWAEAHYPGTYAGYYVDHRAGGIAHIGFTQEQGQRVAEIKQQVNLIAPFNRVNPYSNVPATPRSSIYSTAEAIYAALNSNPALRSVIISVDTNEELNRVEIGAGDVSQAQGLIEQIAGSAAPVSIYFEPVGVEPLSGRLRDSGRILAGDRLITESALGEVGECTSGYGVWEDRTEKSTGELVRARFLLTAGHCVYLNSVTARSATPGLVASTLEEVGPVNRSSYTNTLWATDAAAVRVKGGLAPNMIYRKGLDPLPVDAPTQAKKMNILCFSGITTDRKRCGPVIGRPEYAQEGHRLFGYLVDMRSDLGDSGAPVWNPNTGASIGLVGAKSRKNKSLTYVVPLIQMRNKPPALAPGALNALSLPDPSKPRLNLIVGD
jgi:tripartite motif-containing protein 71